MFPYLMSPSPLQQQPEKPGSKADDIYREGGALGYYGKRNGANLEHGLDRKSEFDPSDQAIEAKLAKVKSKAEREKLKNKLEATGKPFPEAVRKELEVNDREALHKRLLEEFYGGNEKLKKAYIDAVREAIEVPGGDALHQFIKTHLSYKGGNYKAWGDDFMELVNLPEDSEVRDLPDLKRLRIIAALQGLLVDKFGTDIFQLHAETNRGLRINPLIRIDGKLGGYSVSVLSAYWQREYGKESKKKPNPLGFAALEKGNRKMFDHAMVYLDAQLGRAKGKNLDSGVAKGIYVAEKQGGEAVRKGKEAREGETSVMARHIEVNTYLLPRAKRALRNSKKILVTAQENLKKTLAEKLDGESLLHVKMEKENLEKVIRKAEKQLAYYQGWVKALEKESAGLKKNPNAASEIKDRRIVLDTFMIPDLKYRLFRAKMNLKIAKKEKRQLEETVESKGEMLKVAEKKDTIIEKESAQIKNLERYLKHYEAESKALAKEKLT